MNRPAKIIQLTGSQPFQFTIGDQGVVSIFVDVAEKDFLVYSILVKEPEPVWRAFTYSGKYLIEWIVYEK